jgi:hypothetical protein
LIVIRITAIIIAELFISPSLQALVASKAFPAGNGRKHGWSFPQDNQFSIRVQTANFLSIIY